MMSYRAASMKFIRLCFLSICFLLAWFSVFSQERCGTVTYEKQLQLKNPSRQTSDQFERWLSKKIVEQKLNLSSNKTQGNATYNIPIVVHVLYNTDVQNISDAQIKSQIDVLNNDFQRLNADASKTASEFLTVAGGIDIHFVLAQQDPNGLPSTGINRVKVSQNGFGGVNSGLVDDNKIKGYSYWPAEDYLNIWVVNFTDNTLGYAQYPESSGLAGIPLGEKTGRLTDGLVIQFSAFGTSDAGNFNLKSQYNKGRTATHEMGHFLGGLRHIWGDVNDCSGTDYVADTPNQQKATTFCPSGKLTSCGQNSMYQNYMDYTDDACMNLFSNGQIERIKTVLANSPRRVSLLTSPGIVPPINLATDIKLISIDSPSPVFCSASVAPTISVKNLGSDVISKFKVLINVNGTSTIQNITGLTLASGEQRQVTLQSTAFILGANTLNITLSEPNGFTDANSTNNTLSINLIVNTSKDIIPLRQNLDGNYASDWAIISQAQSKRWTSVSTNKKFSLEYNAFSNSALDDNSWFVSPTLDFSQTSKASLFFDISYASRDSFSDALQVLSSKDCGVNFSTVEYSKNGPELSGNLSGTSWMPTTNQDWTREFINLTSLAGSKNVRLAFVVTNGNGNNLFLDNIELFTDDNPAPVTAEVPYSIYSSTIDFKVTFNLPDRQDVRLQVFDVIGHVIADQALPNILNQTYQGDIRLQASGLYIVRMQIGNQFYTSKVFVNH